MTNSTSRHQMQMAMIMMVIAMLIIPGVDAIAKWVSGTISAGEVTWGRFFFQTLFMLPLVLRSPSKLFVSGIIVHFARGTTLAAATLLFFWALKFLPMADAIAIFFVEPLLVTLLATLFLKEKTGWQRWIAIAVGLAGSQLIIRPNFVQFGWSAALPLGAALAFALYILLTRSISQKQAAATMQFYAGAFGFIFLSIIMLVGHKLNIPVLTVTWPTAVEWVLIALVGLIATVAHWLVVHAFMRAPVNVLAPFQYIEIISATILGFIFFDDFPDTLTLCGIIIIISSGLYVVYSEEKSHRT